MFFILNAHFITSLSNLSNAFNIIASALIQSDGNLILISPNSPGLISDPVTSAFSKTFESTRHKDIYVVGDAAIAAPLPKSGYAANSEAKVCAAAVVAKLNGKPTPVPSYVNTCYSIIAENWGISVAAVYQLVDGKIVGVKGAGGLSPMDAKPETRAIEAQYARSWFKNITSDMFTWL